MVYKKKWAGLIRKPLRRLRDCNKWLTAALVIRLWMREQSYRWMIKVVKYIPGLKVFQGCYITIIHCLSHMTNIEDDDKFPEAYPGRRNLIQFAGGRSEWFCKKISEQMRVLDFWYLENVGLNIADVWKWSVKKIWYLIKTKLFIAIGDDEDNFYRSE